MEQCGWAELNPLLHVCLSLGADGDCIDSVLLASPQTRKGPEGVGKIEKMDDSRGLLQFFNPKRD